MKRIKQAMAGLAAAGLMLSVPVQAQEANELEEALGVPAGSGLLVTLFLVVVLVGAAALVFEDDGDTPRSP